MNALTLPADQGISTLELMRTLWPMFIFIIGIIWGQVNVFFRVKQMDKDLGSILNKEGTLLKEFREREYDRDKTNILGAIKTINQDQRASEKRMEDKLDAFRTTTDVKLDKLSDMMTTNSIILAEIRGRPYPRRNKQLENEAD